MKRIFPMLLVVFLLIMSAGIFNFVSAQDGFDIGFDEFGEIGDYIETKIMTGEDAEMKMGGYIRLETTHEETITVKGESYDCGVVSLKGSGNLEYDFGPEGTWRATGNVWWDKVAENRVKATSNIKINVKYQSEFSKITRKSTSIYISSISTWTSEADPELGDEWTETIVADLTETETSDTPDGINSETDTYTVTTIEHYKYIEDKTITTQLGSFECRVIKSYEEDDYDYQSGFNDTDTYDLDYIDNNNNIPLRFESYEDGSLAFELEVIAYNFGEQSGGTEVVGTIDDEKEDEDSGMLGLGKVAGIDIFILVLVAIIILVILVIVGFAMKKLKRSRLDNRDYEYSRPPPPSQPPQQQQQGLHYSCRTCGEHLEYVGEYDSWYCNYCRRYQ